MFHNENNEYAEEDAIVNDCMRNWRMESGRFLMTTGCCSRKYRSNSVHSLMVCVDRDTSLCLCSYYVMVDTKKNRIVREGRR